MENIINVSVTISELTYEPETFRIRSRRADHHAATIIIFCLLMPYMIVLLVDQVMSHRMMR